MYHLYDQYGYSFNDKHLHQKALYGYDFFLKFR